MRVAPTAASAKALTALGAFGDALGELMTEIANVPDDSINELCKSLVRVRDLKKAVDDQLTAVSSFHETLNAHRVPNAIQKLELDAVKIGSYTFTNAPKLYASIPNDKQEEGFAWLRQHELGVLIKESVNAATLSAAIKELMLEKGIAPPNESISVHLKNNIQVRKS